MEFLGIGLPELLVILLIALLVVGPQRLPQAAAQIARAVRQIRRYTTEVTEQLREELDKLEAEYEAVQAEMRQTREELRRAREEVDKLTKAAVGIAEEEPQPDEGRAPPEGPNPQP